MCKREHGTWVSAKKFFPLLNSGAAALDGTGEQITGGQPAMKPFWEISHEEMQMCLKATSSARQEYAEKANRSLPLAWHQAFHIFDSEESVRELSGLGYRGVDLFAGFLTADDAECIAEIFGRYNVEISMYNRLISALKKADYKGYLSIEAIPGDGPAAPYECTRASTEYLRKVLDDNGNMAH